MKKVIFLILFFVPVFCPGQVITSLQTIVFPGTDSAEILRDTVTISVNDEAGTISISYSDGQRIYPVTAVEPGKDCKRYYLQGKRIYYVEIYNEFILISFAIAPTQPIKLIDFKK